MRRMLRLVMISLLATAACLAAEPRQAAPVLLVVLDGLRPDYVTPDYMPNLSKLAQNGVLCESHHSVFPTVTRVNSASISTGSYPGSNGLLGNSVYFPNVEKNKGLSTGEAANLQRIDQTIGGKLLTVPTLADVLKARGLELFVASSGSTGSAFLQDPRGHGIIVNVGLVLPGSFTERVAATLGPAPSASDSLFGRNSWAVDAYLSMALREMKTPVSVVWLSDPDHTAHATGVGSPQTLEAVRAVDRELGRILAAHKAMSVEANILVISDHGFTTHGSKHPSLVRLLVEAGLKSDETSEDVVIADGAIHVNVDKDRVPRIVRLLQQQPWIGAVFTRAASPGSMQGEVPGAFSLEALRLQHERSPEIQVAVAWNDGANSFGFRGASESSGVAGHGSLCPWDVHAVLVASGPDFKRGVRTAVPTGNVDIAPTICRLLGLTPSMDGRILEEILRGGPDTAGIHVARETFKTRAPSGREFLLQTSRVGQARYVDHSGLPPAP